MWVLRILFSFNTLPKIIDFVFSIPGNYFSLAYFRMRIGTALNQVTGLTEPKLNERFSIKSDSSYSSVK